MKSKKITENIEIHKIKQAEANSWLEDWLKEEFKETHPIQIAKVVFPKDVMEIITSDHHKSKDGYFYIGYDFWENKWFMQHRGYIREVEASDENYLECAMKFLHDISRRNAEIKYEEKLTAVNEALPMEYSVSLGIGGIEVHHYKDGDFYTMGILVRDVEKLSAGEILKEVQEFLRSND